VCIKKLLLLFDLLCVVPKARVIRSVYRFAGHRSLLTALVVGLSNLFSCCNLVPSGSELSSGNKSRLSCCGGVCSGKAVRVVLVGVFSNMNIKLSSTRPAPRHPARILLVVIVFTLARIYISTNWTREMRPKSSQRATSVPGASARSSGGNIPTSSC